MYHCDSCNYSSSLHSNYKKHCKTKKHIKNIEVQNKESESSPIVVRDKSNIDDKKHILKRYICNACELDFNNKANFARHKQRCSEKRILHYEHKINDLIRQLKEKDIITRRIIKANEKALDTIKETSNKALDTVKESVRKESKSIFNIVINQIKKPILLKQVEDVKQIHNAYKDDEMEEFVRDLCSMQQNGSLYKFIGNFIIKQYKKEDISEQSMFSTDSSRSNFIYSTLDKNNKAIWKRDPKGLNVGSITLDNVLFYIQDMIREQQLIMVKRMPQLSEIKILKLSDIISTCNKIDRLIRHNNELKNKIVTYLSSNFGFDERELLLENY